MPPGTVWRFGPDNRLMVQDGPGQAAADRGRYHVSRYAPRQYPYANTPASGCMLVLTESRGQLRQVFSIQVLRPDTLLLDDNFADGFRYLLARP